MSNQDLIAKSMISYQNQLDNFRYKNDQKEQNMSVKVGDVERTKDKYPMKGEVREVDLDTVTIDTFNGDRHCIKNGFVEILTGFQAVKPGDIVITPRGSKYDVLEVIGGMFSCTYEGDVSVISYSIKAAEKNGWTIKSQAPAKPQWHDMTKEEVKEHLFEEVWMWFNYPEKAKKQTIHGMRGCAYLSINESFPRASLERPY
jgi:hypothetical protein